MKRVTFVSWNVNGIRAVAKKGALKWVDEMPMDFLGLQEIKAENKGQVIMITQFQIFFITPYTTSCDIPNALAQCYAENSLA